MGHMPAECDRETVDSQAWSLHRGKCWSWMFALPLPRSKEFNTPVCPMGCGHAPCNTPLSWAVFLNVLAFLGLFLLGLRAHLPFSL